MTPTRGLVLAAALALGACATLTSDPGDTARARQLTSQLNSDGNLMYVTASIRGDRAYLHGWVPSYSQRKKAEDLASATPGVHHVYDAIGVGANDRGPRS
jgi:osmotically-inducible protein OsmY